MPYPGLRAASCKYWKLLQHLILYIPHRDPTFLKARGALPQSKLLTAARDAAWTEGFLQHIQGAQQSLSFILSHL